ncbi:MAG: helix-turn-helix domain-containing protein [Firmicutes bacterium]|nr:helix-turn-helix domain-containing protein [Bacillota bacterium]
MKLFIERLTETIAEHNLTNEQFAKLISISEYRLNNWLSDKSKPRANHLYKICKKLKVSCDYLLGLEEKK